jgi:hypothetical protein
MCVQTMVFIFSARNKESVSCAVESVCGCCTAGKHKSKELQTCNILLRPSSLNHTQKTQLVHDPKLLYFESKMTNFHTYNGSLSYSNKHIQLQWHDWNWGRLCWISGIKELSVWDCIKELVRHCMIHARGTQNCHFWLLKQMKTNQYTSNSGTMPASRYKCAKSRQAEPWQSVFQTFAWLPRKTLCE